MPYYPKYETCLESSKVVEEKFGDNPRGNHCSFANSTGNQDSATIMMSYENGCHYVDIMLWFLGKPVI